MEIGSDKSLRQTRLSHWQPSLRPVISQLKTCSLSHLGTDVTLIPCGKIIMTANIHVWKEKYDVLLSLCGKVLTWI